ncbi:TPA: hypothetical protein HA265_07760 [Candidatus Woesearchaeota archaeon]|nr:hypothetical protein [Candidatus Woesearchaeota archaeon]
MTETLRSRIIGLLATDLSKFYSISDVAKRLGVAYSHAHKFIQELAEQGIITIEKVGNVSVCRLNLKEQMTLAHLSMIEYKKTAEWKKKNPQGAKVIEKVEAVKEKVHCVLVKNNNVIIVVPEGERPDMTIFRNRSVINAEQLRKNRDYYKDAVVVHGAEKYWSLLT